jgi:type IV secretory pathway component VirB8
MMSREDLKKQKRAEEKAQRKAARKKKREERKTERKLAKEGKTNKQRLNEMERYRLVERRLTLAIIAVSLLLIIVLISVFYI